MRVFDNLSQPQKIAQKGPRRSRGKAGKNKTRGRIEMSPEQIRAKLEKNRSGKLSIKEKLEKTKEKSSFLSEETAAKVTLTSINKNSQKFPKPEKASAPGELPENLIREEADSTDEIFEANVEITEAEEVLEGEELDPDRPGALKNDPSSFVTVNKLKDALNAGVFRVDAKTKKVLGEIIASRT